MSRIRPRHRATIKTAAAVLPAYPAGAELVAAGQCPAGYVNPFACIVCPFGHLVKCHHPKRCDEAGSGCVKAEVRV